MESRMYERQGVTVALADAIDANNVLRRMAYVWGDGMAPIILLFRVNLQTGQGNIQMTQLSQPAVLGGGDLVWTVPQQELAQTLYDLGVFDRDNDDLPDDLAQQLRDLL